MFVMVGVFGFLLGSYGINSYTNDLSLQTDSVMALGHLELVLKDADGNIKQYLQTDNLIVNEGANTMVDLIFPITNPTGGLNNNLTDTQFGVIGIGTGASGSFVSLVSLESPIAGCANQTANVVEGHVANLGNTIGAQAILSATFSGGSSPGCTGTITEAVVQNDIAGKGELLTHKTFQGITLEDADTLKINWFIELG